MSSSPQIALVAGANKGIGFEIARQLGQLGIEIILGARDKYRGMEAATLPCAALTAWNALTGSPPV